MSRHRRIAAGVLLLLAYLPALPGGSRASEDVPLIAKEALKERLGESGLVVIDVRYDKNWRKSTQKIAGAVRENPNDIGLWTGKYPKERKIVLYCD